MQNKIQTNKEGYSVKKFMGGYYGIVFMDGTIVFGGDSANEDDYNEDYINEVFDNWNGELVDGKIETE